MMGESSLPASALLPEIGPVIADADQFRIRDGAFDQFKRPEKILMPFAQTDRAYRNKPGLLWNRLSRHKNRGVHAERVHKTFFLRNAVGQHGVPDKRGG